MQYEHLQSENEKLKRENKLLTAEIRKLRSKNPSASKALLGKLGSKIVLGAKLKDSITQYFIESEKQEVSAETKGNVVSHILWRVTRIGIYGFLVALLPTILLFVQTLFMYNQNTKIEYQNDRIVEQNQLMEGERRSSYVFLLGNLMEAINDELQLETNTDRELSSQLVGQIISLSHSLKPYKFLLDKNEMSGFYSPERTQLFIFLLESKLSSKTLASIFTNGSFSHLHLSDYVISEIKGFDVSLVIPNSFLRNVTIEGCEFLSVILDSSEISESLEIRESSFALFSASVNSTDTSRISLVNSDFDRGNIICKGNIIMSTHGGSISLTIKGFRGASFENALLSRTYFERGKSIVITECILEKTKFDNFSIKRIDSFTSNYLSFLSTSAKNYKALLNQSTCKEKIIEDKGTDVYYYAGTKGCSFNKEKAIRYYANPQETRNGFKFRRTVEQS